MRGITLHRIARALVIQAASRLSVKWARGDAKSPEDLLDAALLTSFKKIADPLSTIRGRGIGQVNRYAFLTVRELKRVFNEVTSTEFKSIEWRSDYVPALRKLVNDKSVSDDTKEAAYLYLQFFTFVKKMIGKLASVARQRRLSMSTVGPIANEIFHAGSIIADEAERISRLQDAKTVELFYVLTPTKRGHLVGFSLFETAPVGHDKPFFQNYRAVRGHHFKVFLEENGKLRRMMPTNEWAADKIGPYEYNLGVTGIFKTTKEHAWKTVKLVADNTKIDEEASLK